MRTEKPLQDDISMQAYGFNYMAWLKAESEANPVMSMPGQKLKFGNVVSSKNKGVFTFKIVKRTSAKMKKALFAHISSMFVLSQAIVEIKRKAYEKVSGINSISDLDEYITAQMKGKKQLIFRISW